MLPAADKLVLRLTVIVGVLGLNVHLGGSTSSKQQ
jgi:hypothetical protein